MSVYVDPARWPWRGKLWAHLLADDVEELHTFAQKLGLQRSWFQMKGGAHYDVTAAKRAQALKLGALAVDSGNPDEYKRVLRQARVQLAALKAALDAPDS